MHDEIMQEKWPEFEKQFKQSKQEAKRYVEENRRDKEEAETIGLSSQEIAQESAPPPSDQERPTVQQGEQWKQLLLQ